MVSIRWYLGYLKGQLGGAGACSGFGATILKRGVGGPSDRRQNADPCCMTGKATSNQLDVSQWLPNEVAQVACKIQQSNL